MMIADRIRSISLVKFVKSRLMDSPLAYRLVHGAFWALAGVLGQRVLTFLVSILVARILGAVGFGELGIIQSTLGMFGVLAGFGLGTAATKYIAEYRLKDPGKADRIASFSILFALFCSGVISVACVLLSTWLAAQTLNRPEIAPMLSSGAILLFISTMGGVLSAILAGFEAFKTIAKINIWQGVAALVVTYPLVYLYNVEGAIASFTISAAVGLILSAVAARVEYRKHYFPCSHDRSIFHEWPIIWKYALPATLAGLMVTPVIWLTNMILVNQSGGYAEMGLFNAANQWRTAIISILSMLMSVMLSVLSETHGRDDKTDFKKIVSFNLRMSLQISLPLSILIITFSVPLAASFGREFLEAAPIIALLIAAVFLHVVTGSVGSALSGAGRAWTGTFMNLGWAAIMVICSLLFVPHLGGRGLAIAYLISYFIHGIWVMFYVEMKLARSTISGQWKLVAFSILIISASVYASLIETDRYYVQGILVLLSCLPILGKLTEVTRWRSR